MVSLSLSLGAIADGQIGDASDVLLPFNELAIILEDILNGGQGFDGLLFNTNEVTIDGAGAITVSKGLHTVDTFGNAASDDLATIDGLADGQIAIIRASDTTRTVVIKHGTSNILSATSADLTLDNDNKPVLLIGKGLSVIAAPLYALTAGGESVAIMRDEKSTGTNGGGGTLLTWNARNLNTESYDPDGIVTISSNKFVPIPGDYLLQARAKCGGTTTHRHRLRLYNVSQATSVEEGLNSGSGSTTNIKTMAELACAFTANGSDEYRIDHYTSATVATDGLGVPVNDGSPEVYLEVVLRKRG